MRIRRIVPPGMDADTARGARMYLSPETLSGDRVRVDEIIEELDNSFRRILDIESRPRPTTFMGLRGFITTNRRRK